MSSNSLPETKNKLRNLAREYRDGSRDGSFIGPQTPETTGREGEIEWTQLANDLEDIGIPREVIAKNRRFFAAWLAEAILKQTPEQEQPALLDRLWKDTNTQHCEEEDGHRCNFCNSNDHDTYQHELFGSGFPLLMLTPGTASDTTNQSDDTGKSFFDGLGSTGYSIEVGFGGADPLRAMSLPSGNASLSHADASIESQRRPSSVQTDTTKETKTKLKISLAKFSTLGSSSPSMAQVRSPFGGGLGDVRKGHLDRTI